MGERRIIDGDEVVAVVEGGGRGIVGEAQGVALVLAWWKKEGVPWREILEKRVGCTDGLLRDSTMVEIGAKHSKVTCSTV